MAVSGRRTVLITGGAGFIGCNLAERLLQDRDAEVRIFDNLSRAGVEHNLAWLRGLPGSERLQFVRGDVRSFSAVTEAMHDVTEIYHLAAQTAVTTSISDPRTDFDVNVLGTFHVLEAARLSGRKPFLLATSTNKVYGALHGVAVRVDGSRYRAEDGAFSGVNEDAPLDFHSPYGCSKGAADQYVRDYARIYELPTVVFRMSCIAGPRQFGNEDQGWVAHLLYSVVEGRPVTIYGDGFQVRDVLHVHDLVNAMEATRRSSSVSAGQIYNVGGGMDRAISVVEMLHAIERYTGRSARVRYSGMRAGDQPLYISDTGKLSRDTGWSAQLNLEKTLSAIGSFWEEHRELITRQWGRIGMERDGTNEMVTEAVA